MVSSYPRSVTDIMQEKVEEKDRDLVLLNPEEDDVVERLNNYLEKFYNIRNLDVQTGMTSTGEPSNQLILYSVDEILETADYEDVLKTEDEIRDVLAGNKNLSQVNYPDIFETLDEESRRTRNKMR